MRGSRGRHAPAHVRRGALARAEVDVEPARRAPPPVSPGRAAEPASASVSASSATALLVAPRPERGGRLRDADQWDDLAELPVSELPVAEPPLAEPPLAERAARRERGRPAADRPRALRGRALLSGVARRDRTLVVGGARLRLLVLGCTEDDTTAVDVASGALLRLRIPWPVGHEPDLAPFDVVEATLAEDPERDDLAQPEAATASSLPRLVGSLRGRRARRMLARLAVPPDGPLLGFLGPSAPYWEFRGLRPSIALVHPGRGPQLIRRRSDGSTWVRFGWDRDDVWLPVEDRRTVRALDASRRDRLSGKALSTALGFTPHYVLAAVSSPRDGHCYKVCAAILPRG